MSVAYIMSRKIAMFLAQSLILVGMNAGEIYADEEFDCNFEIQISDIAGQINADELMVLDAKVGKLNMRYNVDTFFCLSESTLTTSVDDHVNDILEYLFASLLYDRDGIFIYGEHYRAKDDLPS